MRRHDGFLAVISIGLVISVCIGLWSVLAADGFTPPENPIGANAEMLIPETLEGSGEFAGNRQDTPQEQQAEEAEPPQEPETPEPEEPEPPEPQESEKPEDPDPQISDVPESPGESETPQTSAKPDDPADGEGEITDGEPPSEEQGGGSDSGESGDGSAGSEEGSGGEGGTGIGGDGTVKIVTDLTSRLVTRTELPDGILRFFARPSEENAAYSVKAVINNSSTPMNGQVLESADGLNYEAALVLNETTTVTLYLKENGENLAYARYRIRYETEKADEENPEVGDAPPTIVTNLDGFTGLMETQDFLFWVSARTNPEGMAIYSNQIEVWLNDEPVAKQTGDSRPEYELHFEPPNVGDSAEYTVKVRAWDGRGNSTMKVYTVNYHTVSEGDRLGEVSVVLDATTVGLGIIDSAVYEIVQGDTAAGIVIRFLEDYGYEAVYDGSATVGFYLRSISRGDLCSGAAVPERLWEMIGRDGITLSGTSSRDRLSEYDYTMGSGWMYSIDGSIYPGRGLSDYPLSRDTTIYLRFTLAYGKDIAGFDATGEGNGSLSGYCGVWTGGGYTPLEHSFGEPVRVEPTATADGYSERICTVCRETEREVLPATGETPPPSEAPETTDPPAAQEPEVTDPPPAQEGETTAPPVTDEPEVTDPPPSQPPDADPIPTENEDGQI